MKNMFVVCLHLQQGLGLLAELLLFQDILFPGA